jgi:Ca2+/H+ antiporter, TMEM165/GDT1 family
VAGEAFVVIGLAFPARNSIMEAFLVSAGVVALGEVGDKTQLLALLLAARFKRPVPIVLGILVATLINHACAGLVGAWVASALGPVVLRWVIGMGFIAMAVWMLIPDKIDEDEANKATWHKLGVFGTTVVAFFMAEMGDKTQIATVALAARYNDLISVVSGTTIGLMLADVPAILLGHAAGSKLSMKWVHGISAVIFAVLGMATLLNVGRLF